jgi:1-acyl-sn-glycerol-3-phosphate acyltransferase
MNNFRHTARAIVALVVMVSLVLLLGGLALMVGVFYPSRGLMNVCTRVWARAVLFCAGVRLTIIGGERAATSMPAFFIGNHQSGLDIPIIMFALRGQVRFMAKDSLFRIPLFGWVIRRYGFVPIDRSNVRRTLQTLKGMIAVVHRDPISMTAFPEGTRSRAGVLLPFRRGTMKIVQQAGLPVIPFAIDGSIRVHHPDRLLRAVPGPVTLTFAEPISADRAVEMDQDELQALVVGAVAGALGQSVPRAKPNGHGVEACEPECSDEIPMPVLSDSSLRSE